MAKSAGKSGEAASAYAQIELDLQYLRSQVKQAVTEFKGLKKGSEKEVGGVKDKVGGLSKTFTSLSTSLSSFSTLARGSMGSLGGAVSGATGQMASLTAVAGSGTAAMGALGAAVGGVVAGLTILATLTAVLFTFASETEKWEKSMTSAGVVARKMGYDVKGVFDTIRVLNDTTIFSTDALANFSQIFTRAGASMDEFASVTMLMQDNLRLTPTLTKSADEALSQLYDSAMQGNSQLLNEIGLGERTWEQMEIQGRQSLQSQGKNVTQLTARLEGLKLALEDTKGGSKVLGETMSDQFNRMNKEFNQAKIVLGAAFKPVFIELLKIAVPLIRQFTRWLISIDWAKMGKAIANTVKMFWYFKDAIWQALKVVMPFINGIEWLMGLMGGFKRDGNAVTDMMDQLADSINQDVDATGLKEFNEEVDKAKKKLAELQQELAKENEEFNRKLAEIIVAHEKNLEEALKDLEGETKEFGKQQKNAAKDFENTMNEMAEEHAARLADIQRDRAKSDADFERSERKKRKAHDETMADMKEANKKRLNDLRRQLQQEYAASGGLNQNNIELLEQAIKEEEALLNGKLDAEEKKFQEEKADRDSEQQEKMSDLDARWAEEMKKYEKQVGDKKMKYDEDTNNSIAANAKRVADIQAKIAEEQAFLAKHAEIRKNINRGLLRDEIEEAQAAHSERVADLQKQMNEQKLIIGGGFDDWKTMQGQSTSWLGADMKKLLGGMTTDQEEFKKKFDLPTWMKKKWDEFIAEMPSWVGKVGKFLTNPIGFLMEELWKKISGFFSEKGIGFDTMGKTIGEGFKKMINSLIDRINTFVHNFGNFYIPWPVGESVSIFPEWAKISKFRKGGIFGGGTMGIMNEGGLDETIQLPQGTRIFSNEKTQSLFNSMKDQIRQMNFEMPNVLSKYAAGIANSITADKGGMGYNYTQQNQFDVRTEVDIKRVARQLDFEAKSRGILI